MRAIHVPSLVLIGTAALALGTPAALADDGGSITSFGSTITPTTQSPGDPAPLSGTECEAEPGNADCLGEASTSVADGSDLYGGQTGKTGQAEMTDPTDGTDMTGKAEPSKPMEPVEPAWPVEPTKPVKPVKPAKPIGGVKGGTGGSFADLSPTQIGVGSALIAGALAGGGVLMLRRPNENGS
ncbi:hypothetical protein FBY35_4366 [Streptomyces sp. SLBN-118]|uniref:hypothetical protein n=1 Tax=Streptomyces sp. SLBN-118 TaxID=2768454 RepID=UPI00116CCE11|nr:hypothetical protein [Streptomyces sp. SLBN-118]TQK42921.1 hypothetical protein FBY35_4366 [Streptomyces sp. SLBN-118]